MSASISLSMSAVVVSFWFILNQLQFLANVFQSVCAVWYCRLALFWVVSERTTSRRFDDKLSMVWQFFGKGTFDRKMSMLKGVQFGFLWV